MLRHRYMDIKILRELPFWEIIKACEVSKSYSRVCKSDIIWSEKLKQLYPDLINMKPKNLSYYEYYIELIKYLNYYYNDRELYDLYGLYDAVEDDNTIEDDDFVGANDEDDDYNNVPLVNYTDTMIEKIKTYEGYRDNDVYEYFKQKLENIKSYPERSPSISEFSIIAIEQNRLDILILFYIYIGYSVTEFYNFNDNDELTDIVKSIIHKSKTSDEFDDTLKWLVKHSTPFNLINIGFWGYNPEE